MKNPKFKRGEEVYFRSGHSPLLKAQVVDFRVLPAGCLWMKWEEPEYRVQIPGQGWSLWVREDRLFRNIHEYDRWLHS